MSKMNFTPMVSINELRKMIPLIASELTVVVQSEPGCGKTSLLSMIAADNGDTWRSPKDGTNIEGDKYDYIYVDCPVKDMSDIGMTIPNHASKTLEYYVAELFNMKSNKPKYILLDELMKSPKLMQVIYTRLMLERSVGDDPLPLGENATMVALAGTIGASAAGDMAAFMSLEKSLMDVKDIIKKPKDVTMPTDISAQLMIMFQAVDTLATQDELTSFMEFVGRINSSEVQAVFFTMMMRSPKAVRLARNNAKIAEWAKNNHELF